MALVAAVVPGVAQSNITCFASGEVGDCRRFVYDFCNMASGTTVRVILETHDANLTIAGAVLV